MKGRGRAMVVAAMGVALLVVGGVALRRCRVGGQDPLRVTLLDGGMDGGGSRAGQGGADGFPARASPLAGSDGRDGGTPPDGPRFTLGKAGSVAGVVQDEAGHPVAGAHLVVLGGDAFGASLERFALPGVAPTAKGARWFEPAGELGILHGLIPFPPPAGAIPDLALSADSDGQGRFRIDGIVPARVTLVASHPSYVDARSGELPVTAGATAEVSLTMRPGLAARGRVLDEHGPVAGAELWRFAESTGPTPSAVMRLATVCGADGRFELGRLPPSAVDVEVRARGHVPTRVVLDPAAGEVEIHIGSAAGRVTGVVLDERGFPVAGAELTLRGPSGEQHRAASDRKGEFQVEGTGAGPLTLVVRASHYPPLTVPGVAPGDDHRVVLLPGGGLAGDVRDAASGASLTNLKVSIEDARGERHVARLVDARGHFEAHALAPGRATLRAEADGYLPATLALEVPAGDRPGEVTLRCEPIELHLGGALVGTVTDEHGNAAVGVSVSAAELVARTDASGRYRLAPLPVGAVRVVAASAVDEAVIQPGREVTLDLRLR